MNLLYTHSIYVPTSNLVRSKEIKIHVKLLSTSLLHQAKSDT